MEPEEEAVDARSVESDIERTEKAVDDAPAEAEAWHLVQLRATPAGKMTTMGALAMCNSSRPLVATIDGKCRTSRVISILPIGFSNTRACSSNVTRALAYVMFSWP